MYALKVKTKGPIFDGRVDSIRARALDESLAEVAAEGRTMVQASLGTTLRHPTGYYSSHIRAERVSATRHEVTDDRVIYGPWLEGTGSRNRTTRFKGYFTFRKTRAALKRRSTGIARAVFRRHLKEM